MPKTIAIVEDDPDQRSNCADALERRGYRILSYGSQAEAMLGFNKELPDLAILDIMLGEEMDAGFDLCRHLLGRNPELPVIFLTSRADDVDRISGLRLGAWDYQTKPVSLPFLAERVGSLLRILDLKSVGEARNETRRIGELEFDETRMEVFWRGESLTLTFTELSLLLEIVRGRSGRGASYEDLARATRQGLVENNTVNTHVMHLRHKFCEVDPAFDCIRNVYGFGYRWCGA